MKLTGFTDEASSKLNDQIRVTQELGWEYLSARTFGAKNIHDLTEGEFEQVCEQLDMSNIKVAEFGTLIGNWSKDILDDFDITKAEVARCIPRMQRLGVKIARIMSFAQRPWGDEQYAHERFKRLRWIVNQFIDADLVPAHENCMNWGGFSAQHSLRLLEEVPGLQLIFDTGNPVFQKDRSKPEPYPYQDALEFYQKTKHAIVHVHVKDVIVSECDEITYTYPGEGMAYIKTIITDLWSSSYDGFVAIEPHMGKVFHEDFSSQDASYEYETYKKFGERMERLIRQVELEGKKKDDH